MQRKYSRFTAVESAVVVAAAVVVAVVVVVVSCYKA